MSFCVKFFSFVFFFFFLAVQSVQFPSKIDLHLFFFVFVFCFWSMWSHRWAHLLTILSHQQRCTVIWKRCLCSFTELIQSACRRVSSSSAAGSFGQEAVCASIRGGCLTLALSLDFSLACRLQTSAPTACVWDSGWISDTVSPRLSLWDAVRDHALRSVRFLGAGEAFLLGYLCGFSGAEVLLRSHWGIGGRRGASASGRRHRLRLGGKTANGKPQLPSQSRGPLDEPCLVPVTHLLPPFVWVARLEGWDDGHRARAQGRRKETRVLIQASAGDLGPSFPGSKVRQGGPAEEHAHPSTGGVAPECTRGNTNNSLRERTTALQHMTS